MTIPRLENFDVKVASALASRIRLRDVIVAGLEARMLMPLTGGELNFDMPKADVRWIRNGADLKVVMPYQVNVSESAGRSTQAIAEFRVLLRVDYEVDADVVVSDAQIQHFVGVSAFMHSWPYLRAEIASLTTKLRFPALVLPVVVSGNAPEHIAVSPVAVDLGEQDVSIGVAPRVSAKSLPSSAPARRKARPSRAVKKLPQRK